MSLYNFRLIDDRKLGDFIMQLVGSQTDYYVRVLYTVAKIKKGEACNNRILCISNGIF